MKISVGLLLKPIFFSSSYSSWFYKRREYEGGVRKVRFAYYKMLGRPEKTGAVDSTRQLSWRWWSSVVQIAQWKAGCLLVRTLPPEPNLSITLMSPGGWGPEFWGPWAVAASASTAPGDTDFILQLSPQQILRFGHAPLDSRHIRVSILFPDLLSRPLNKKTKKRKRKIWVCPFL